MVKEAANHIPRIIAVTNQKGGSGKTTTSVNLSAGLAIFSHRVLLVDLDPQANASMSLGIVPSKLEHSMYEVMIHPDQSVGSITVDTPIHGLRLAPSSIHLSGAEVELVNIIGREHVLKDSLHLVHPEYDFIIIDCPPSLGLLTLNGLTSAKEVIIPVQAQYLALEGLGQLMNTIEVVRQRLNPELALTGVLTTLYTSGTRLCDQVHRELQAHFQERMFNTVIRTCVKLAEAPSHGLPIMLYAPRSSAATGYLGLAEEVIGREP